MPASLPGETLVNNMANPNAGMPIAFDLLSGPKGSPFDVRKLSFTGVGNATYTNDAANQKPSTGALSTGIGFGIANIIGPISHPIISNSLNGILKAGFSDNVIPGATTLDAAVPATDSRFMYIGGGKTTIVAGTGANGNGYPASWKVASTVPYTAGYGIGFAGNSGSRDAGAGPAFTGFAAKMVTAAAGVAIGAVVETGFVNRSGVALTTGQSLHGSSTTATAAVA